MNIQRLSMIHEYENILVLNVYSNKLGMSTTLGSTTLPSQSNQFLSFL